MTYLIKNRKFWKVLESIRALEANSMGIRTFRVSKVVKFVQTSMKNIKMRIYKRVLKEFSEKYDGADYFINNRIEEICPQEKLSAEEVIYFLVSSLQFTFPC